MKINGVDHNDWLYPWQKKGNTLEETKEICSMLLDDGKGVDAFHISSGSTFPHPRIPPGDFPVLERRRWYDGMLSQGVRTRFNYCDLQQALGGQLFRRYWRWRCGPVIEGINARVCARDTPCRAPVDESVKVLCTGGFQHADKIAEAIRWGRV